MGGYRTLCRMQSILVTGGSGFIGRHLLRRLAARGDATIVLSRDPLRSARKLGAGVRVIGSLDELPDDTVLDAIVNLAGAPIFGPPWTAARRRLLRDSRLRTTDALMALCRRLRQPPKALVSASAIGYYGIADLEAGEGPAARESDPPQPIFQSQLCQDWETAALAAEQLGLRVVRLRFGIVLGADGGALPPLALPVKLGFGAVLGDGRQGMPWLHLDDAVGIIEYALDHPTLSGAVNAVAPACPSHAEFQRTLGRVLRRPVWLRIPAWPLRAMLGEMAQLFVDGRHVDADRLRAEGYPFRHPQLEDALRSALKGP